MNSVSITRRIVDESGCDVIDAGFDITTTSRGVAAEFHLPKAKS